MKKQPFLFVALDRTSFGEAFELATELTSVSAENFGFKINLDFVLRYGVKSPQLASIVSLGKPVFVDLKMWNGVRTMNSVIDVLVEMGVYCTNVYSHAWKSALSCVHDHSRDKIKVFGLTVLTHDTDEDCRIKFNKSLVDKVRELALVAEKYCDGVILPGTVLEVVKDLSVDKLVPAVRFKDQMGSEGQAQEVSFEDALIGGADYIVCGRPIINSDDPIATLSRALELLKGLCNFQQTK